MARITDKDINEAAKLFKSSKGNDEFLQYFDNRNRIKKIIWYRFIRRKIRRIWMNLLN